MNIIELVLDKLISHKERKLRKLETEVIQSNYKLAMLQSENKNMQQYLK